jgi:PAS domain S-box-containing protein
MVVIKKTEEATLLQTILHESNTEVFSIDAESLRIYKANPAALANLQYTLKELRQLGSRDFLHGEDEVAFLVQSVLLQRGEKKRAKLNTFFHRKDGTSYPVEMRLFLSAHKDKPLIIAIANNDAGVREASRIALSHSESGLAEESKRSREQLSALAANVESVKEQERLAIAREIHDALGGNLTAVKMGLSWLAHHLPPNHADLLEKTEYLDSVIDQTLDAAHRISSNIRPEIIDFGIIPAIKWKLKRFTLNFTIPATFTSSHKKVQLDSDTSIAVFRIVQEALTNIARHARASKVIVRLKKDKDAFQLDIIDNGIGPLPADSIDQKKSFGILGMTERATALGGTLSVLVAPGGGTCVSLQLPSSPPPTQSKK